MPGTSFDVITIGHGSGGQLTNQLLEEHIFPLFDNEYIDQRADGVILPRIDRPVFTTDSFVVSPISFPGGNIGDLAVNGTVNDIAMCGGIPKYISLGLILEEGLDLKVLKEVLQAVHMAANRAGVQIVTGDTKVVERGKGDKMFINSSGIGDLHKKANLGFESVKEGDCILINRSIGSHGIVVMSKRADTQFETNIESDTAPLNHMVTKMLDLFGEDIHLMRDATRGGVATVLAEIALSGKFGIEVKRNAFSVDPEVSAACEMLGYDPLYVANEGAMVTIVAAQRADDVIKFMRTDENGAQASIVGNIVYQHEGKVIISNEIGGRSVLNMLPGEQLPRIC
ncbi:MAG: hydrogenase expression/formation protein HypE [Cyclobacteriaceae bacterium]